MAARPSESISLLLAIIDQAFDHASWHGPNLRGSLRGLDAAAASFRPAPGRHNIWEHIIHAAYWKYVVRRRLTGEKRGSFPLKGSNWITRPARAQDDPDRDQTLADDIAMLDAAHQSLRTVIAGLPPRRLPAPLDRAGRITPQFLITGIAAHDVYHAGQINLLKRLGQARL